MGTQKITDESFGMVVYAPKEKTFLLIKQHNSHWGFPKGHAELGETSLQAAKRELEEETGLTEIDIHPAQSYEETYFFRHQGRPINKRVTYFLATTKQQDVTIQPEEIEQAAWCTFESAQKQLTYDEARRVLYAAQDDIESLAL
jgi:8-oxo-dGTP pyrophosphatase MutT (NUDIX family)